MTAESTGARAGRVEQNRIHWPYRQEASISRNDEGVLHRPLVQQVLAAGASRDRLSYGTLKIIADLDAAVAEVVGYTRYAIDGDPAVHGPEGAHISVVDRGGISRDVESRVDLNNQLVGTKRRVASERELLVVRGRRDGRTIIMVPEVKAGACTGITLLRVRFHDRLPVSAMRAVLQGYDRRYDRLVDKYGEDMPSRQADQLARIEQAMAALERTEYRPTDMTRGGAVMAVAEDRLDPADLLRLDALDRGVHLGAARFRLDAHGLVERLEAAHDDAEIAAGDDVRVLEAAREDEPPERLRLRLRREAAEDDLEPADELLPGACLARLFGCADPRRDGRNQQDESKRDGNQSDALHGV